MRAAIAVFATLAAFFAGLAAGKAGEAEQPERRIALLIGNDTYPDEIQRGLGTANVVRDLETLSNSFRKTGFEVEVARNLTSNEMNSRFKSFGARAREADVAMVYFTGAGLQVADVDYLAGVDISVPSSLPEDVQKFGFVPVSAAAIAAQPARKFAMVFAEANRTNPWSDVARGLGGAKGVVPSTVDSVAGDSGVAVFYGSQAGRGSEDGPPGGNGPFAAALAKRMLEQGLEIGLFARRVRADAIRATKGDQRPQLYGELGEQEFYFSGAFGGLTVPKPPALILTNQPRLALLIGNGDYNQDGVIENNEDSPAVLEQGFAPDLSNAVNDARDVAAALTRIGFTVDLLENADYQKMVSGLLAFEQKVIEAGEDAIVTVYYSGHAIQVGGANFIVPVGAKVPSVDLERLTGPQAELVLTQFALPIQSALLGRLKNPSKRGLNLIILDACRENPWDRRSAGRGVSRSAGGRGSHHGRGLGEIRLDLRRTAIAFATKPGDIASDGGGKNSPFTSALKAYIEKEGVSVLNLLNMVGEKVENDTNGRQVPWTNSPALGHTCLGACSTVQ